MEALYQNLLTVELNQVIMWAIGGLLIYLAISKEMEPTLLLRWPVQRTVSSAPSFCPQPPAALPSAFYGREKSSPWKRNFFPKGQDGFLYSPVVAFL